MDFEKLKAEFEKLEYINKKLEYLNFDENLDCYVEKSGGMPVGLAAWVNGALYGFQQAAKAQSVPDTYTPIILALEDVQSKIAQASFLNMDADNENEVYAVDANELAAYIDELIEAQEPK